MKNRNLVIKVFVAALAGIKLYCTVPVDHREDIANFNEHVESMDYLIQPEQLDEPILAAVIDSSEPTTITYAV
jgi:hypothetical protein